MTDLLSIPANAVRTIWVFTVDLTEADLETFQTEARSPHGELSTWPLRDALGIAHLNQQHFELFSAHTMKEYGLARYLTEANGMDDTSVAPDASKLDALDGSLLLLFESAIPTDIHRLAPTAPLHLIGRYTEARDYSLRQPPKSTAAHVTSSAKVKKRPSDAAMSGRIATIALILMGLLVWLVIAIA